MIIQTDTDQVTSDGRHVTNNRDALLLQMFFRTQTTEEWSARTPL